jgi:prepilin signal peptidase PulO-like enzyme (type II secretory pathway)
MFSYISLYAFLFGAIIGSFLNVVILRHEKGEGVGGRSYCPSCHKQLVWYELIPVVSYLVQGGRCRGCGTYVSAQYPLVELSTGVAFVLIALRGESVPAMLLDAVMWSLLMVITVYDLRTKLIPDVFSYTFAVLGLMSTLLATGAPALSTLPAVLYPGILLFLPFYLLWWYSEGRWIGLGDGKLALGIGWYLGLSAGANAVMLAFWIGAAVSLLLIGWSRIRFRGKPLGVSMSLRTEVPFGPFLVFGCALAYFFGVNVFGTL